MFSSDAEANNAAAGEGRGSVAGAGGGAQGAGPGGGTNPFLDVPDQARAVEYKKGYVMRKCCVDANGKKSKLIPSFIDGTSIFQYMYLFNIISN